MELKPYTCDKCGGQIDRVTLTCKMCGTQYRLDDDMQPVRVEVSQCKLTTIGTSVAIPAYFLKSNPEDGMEITLHQMAEQMVKKLIPLMEIQQIFDPAYNEYVTYGRIRVAEPNYNFKWRDIND